jgi:NAD(P)-dependent dehydrogenase (short-subunit alcohol dehydrogenase family)
MGRELARQLAAAGCNVAMCDVSAAAMAETKRLCEADRSVEGLRITTHLADVSDEAHVLRLRDEVEGQHETDQINLLFNNAGIGGGGSMIANSRDQWERTFNISWYGVYFCTRTFLPLLMKAVEGHIVNMSGVTGFWASTPNRPGTAVSAAKFAVKGFTEALITDLRLNAPHIKCSVVMPGHIGTSLLSNSRKIQSGSESDTMTPPEIWFLQSAPMTADLAATVILDGVKAERWRILVGDDAYRIDELVRQDPDRAYEADFFDNVVKETGWRLGS